MTPQAMEEWLISYKHGEIGAKEVFAAFEQYYNSQDESIYKAFIEFAQLHVENYSKLLEETNLTFTEYLELHVK